MAKCWLSLHNLPLLLADCVLQRHFTGNVIPGAMFAVLVGHAPLNAFVVIRLTMLPKGRDHWLQFVFGVVGVRPLSGVRRAVAGVVETAPDVPVGQFAHEVH